MERGLAEAGKLLQGLRSSFQSGDVASCQQHLGQLKIRMTQFPALPPLFQKTPTQKEELSLGREVLEYAVLLTVKKEDEAGFERQFLQLKPYYVDTRNSIPPSSREQLITGLNLLRLLVQNRISEFHTELELIPSAQHSSPFIRYAIELEQSLMEGAYQKVLNSRTNLPDQSYAFFVNLLLDTVRDEIAGCSEKAYDFLSLAEAKKMMLLKTDQEVADFAGMRDWDIKNGSIYFRKINEEAISKDIPSHQLITQTLGYARELERIV
ncbi:Hypothetical protein KFL_007350010 [Klebsormidium nitens]|uniref:PCI domain-containing protein n=1 Tax=Klebsormidium nitens TaxID=105231 RepID=A0A1Y1IPM0_KLENI|nr:Hypothetical protein KFL_007350010 [Klebsormidium nitens]|eukprot:GAQ91151.1 Hypothetical protein KFL_007350010 [Klebsormidium nitens]